MPLEIQPQHNMRRRVVLDSVKYPLFGGQKSGISRGNFRASSPPLAFRTFSPAPQSQSPTHRGRKKFFKRVLLGNHASIPCQIWGVVKKKGENYEFEFYPHKQGLCSPDPPKGKCQKWHVSSKQKHGLPKHGFSFLKRWGPTRDANNNILRFWKGGGIGGREENCPKMLYFLGANPPNNPTLATTAHAKKSEENQELTGN